MAEGITSEDIVFFQESALEIRESIRKRINGDADFDRLGVVYSNELLSEMEIVENEELRTSLAYGFGSFVGESIIKSIGGQWAKTEKGYCILFPGDIKVYPINKVYKQLRDGDHGAIVILFDLAEELVSSELTSQSKPTR